MKRTALCTAISSILLLLCVGCSGNKSTAEKLAKDAIQQWAVENLARYEIRKIDTEKISDTRALVHVALGINNQMGYDLMETEVEILKIGNEWIASPIKPVTSPISLTFLTSGAGISCLPYSKKQSTQFPCIRIQNNGYFDWNWKSNDWRTFFQYGNWEFVDNALQKISSRELPDLVLPSGGSMDVVLSNYQWNELDSFENVFINVIVENKELGNSPHRIALVYVP